MPSASQIVIDETPGAIQALLPDGPSIRFEGLAFSTSGNTLGAATADTNSVLLYRRGSDGRFENKPYSRLDGLDYPHDLAFSRCGSTELIAVAQRTGAIALFGADETHNGISPDPVFEISGPESKLVFSDGVAFVPPFNDYLAACNLLSHSISFYRRTSESPVRFAVTPDFELTHHSVVHPDGLAFSKCGSWLAIANHGSHSVTIFCRRNKLLTMGKLVYGPEPISIIADAELRHPHSVAFTDTNHLLVTNAGANFFSIYGSQQGRIHTHWNRSIPSRVIATDDEMFRNVNSVNHMEGGPKGIAIHGNNIAVCSPEFGIKIYSFRVN